MNHKMNRIAREYTLHFCICVVAALTLIPFVFTMNNSFRTNNELFHSFFGAPMSLKGMISSGGAMLTGADKQYEIEDTSVSNTEVGKTRIAGAKDAFKYYWSVAIKGYTTSWKELRGYMINSFIVCMITMTSVIALGSISAYILARYKFYGSKFIFYYIISVMMFPGVLTLVPSFILVKELGLLNTYWAMILPYVAGGQVFAIFVFKSFFEGLPEDLFESARIDGAGHLQMYANIVLPLSKPVLAVVMIMNILGTWNNFLWPFIVNTDGTYHMVSSGLYVLATSSYANNYSSLFAAYMVSSLPLLVLFTYATKPFIQGVTSGAFKA